MAEIILIKTLPRNLFHILNFILFLIFFNFLQQMILFARIHLQAQHTAPMRQHMQQTPENHDETAPLSAVVN